MDSNSLWIKYAIAFGVFLLTGLVVYIRNLLRKKDWMNVCDAHGLSVTNIKYKDETTGRELKHTNYPGFFRFPFSRTATITCGSYITSEMIQVAKPALSIFFTGYERNILDIVKTMTGYTLYFSIPTIRNWRDFDWVRSTLGKYADKPDNIYIANSAAHGPIYFPIKDNIFSGIFAEPGRGKSTLVLRIVQEFERKFPNSPRYFFMLGESPDYLECKWTEKANDFSSALPMMEKIQEEAKRREQTLVAQGARHYLDIEYNPLLLVIDESQLIFLLAEVPEYKKDVEKLRKFLAVVSSKYRKVGINLILCGTESRSSVTGLPMTTCSFRASAGLATDESCESLHGKGNTQSAFNRMPAQTGLFLFQTTKGFQGTRFGQVPNFEEQK